MVIVLIRRFILIIIKYGSRGGTVESISKYVQDDIIVCTYYAPDNMSSMCML